MWITGVCSNLPLTLFSFPAQVGKSAGRAEKGISFLRLSLKKAGASDRRLGLLESLAYAWCAKGLTRRWGQGGGRRGREKPVNLRGIPRLWKMFKFPLASKICLNCYTTFVPFKYILAVHWQSNFPRLASKIRWIPHNYQASPTVQWLNIDSWRSF